MLLESAESFARTSGVNWLRIGVLADNTVADRLYASMGFEAQYIEREKDLTAT
jgi:GNAT superfamily N-acetyltransferase